MASDPFPKVVEHPNGERLTVNDLHEQDAATVKGFLRAIARNREFKEAQAEKD